MSSQITLIIVALLAAFPAQAGTRDQAFRLYNRIAGIPPSDAELDQMDGLIQAGKFQDAAKVATSSFAFYNLNLVRFAKPLSNRDESPRPDTTESSRTPLNDEVTTIIGMIRDGVPFDQVLYGDILYKGVDTLAGVPLYSITANDHFQKLGDQISPNGGLDLRNKAVLEQKKQTDLRTDLPDTAGVLTVRAGGVAWFSAGTNRRPLRFAFKEFLCNDMENVADATVPDDRIRRDVDRAPTGDSRIFLTTCKGCHAGIDALSGAFAFFDFPDDHLVYTPGSVQSKMTKNPIFTGGYRTIDDGWVNKWSTGRNSALGWRGNFASGKGAKALGHALAATRAFSTCMVRRAFKLVCLRDITQADDGDVTRLADAFEANGTYNMRDLIEQTSILPQCIGK